MSSVGLKQGNTPQLKVLERSDLKKKKGYSSRWQCFACNDHTAAISLHQAPRGSTEPIVSVRRASKQTLCLSRGRVFIKGYADDFRAACSRREIAFSSLPQACSVKLGSPVFSRRRLFTFGKLLGCYNRASFHAKLQRMYPVQVLRGAACCCCRTLPGLVPLLLLMQLCSEEVLEGGKTLFCYFFCWLITNLSIVLSWPAYWILLCLFYRAEPDLWDYPDARPGVRGSLSAGSAGPEDQTAPESPSRTRFRGHRDQVQPTCTQTTWQCTQVSGELDIPNAAPCTAHTPIHEYFMD